MIRTAAAAATRLTAGSKSSSTAFGLLVTAAVVAGGGGCADGPRGPVAEDRPVAPITEPGFARGWKARLVLAGERVSQLHVRDGQVFAYTRDNRSFVLDRASGRLIHVSNLETGETVRPPVVLGDRIIYPLNASLAVHTLKSGRRLKEVRIGRPITTELAGRDDVVVFGTTEGGRGRVLLVDVDRPPSLARAAWTAGGMHGKPLIVADRTYFASTDGRVYAADSEMESIWSLTGGSPTFQTGGPIFADLAGDASGVYVASTDTKLYCLNPNSGQVKWVYFAGTELRAGPVVTRDFVYQFVPGQGIAALDKELAEGSDLRNVTHRPRWVYADGTQFLAEDDRFAYVRSGPARIDAVDKQTGQVRFSNDRADLAVFGTNTTDGTIFAATAAGEVMAIKAVPTPGTVGELVMVPPPGDVIPVTAIAAAR